MGAPVSVAATDQDRVYDVDGTAYLDLRGGDTAVLGHRPAPVVAALRDALSRVDMGDHRLPGEAREQLAGELSATLPHGRWRWQFCGSGSEAVEFALRTALAATGRDRLVAIDDGYHGQVGLAAAVTDPRHLPDPFPAWPCRRCGSPPPPPRWRPSTTRWPR
nr:aminotransferase class III-fold pyridoxal phosphate-dependent enzyme [Micromonospora tarapacensis]